MYVTWIGLHRSSSVGSPPSAPPASLSDIFTTSLRYYTTISYLLTYSLPPFEELLLSTVLRSIGLLCDLSTSSAPSEPSRAVQTSRLVPLPPNQDSQISGSAVVLQKMEQALATLREDLEQQVQALSKSRSIEDMATRMAEEVGLTKVRLTGYRGVGARKTPGYSGKIM